MKTWLGLSGLLATIVGIAACGEKPPLQGQTPVVTRAPGDGNAKPATGNDPSAGMKPGGTIANSSATWYDGLTKGDSPGSGAPKPTGTAPDQGAVTDALTNIFGSIVTAAQSGSSSSPQTAPVQPAAAPEPAPAPAPALEPAVVQAPQPAAPSDACAMAANQHVTFSGQSATMTSARGFMRIWLKGPIAAGTRPDWMSPAAMFDGSNWQAGQGGITYQGGKIRNGQWVAGTLILSTGSPVMNVILDSQFGGGTVRVGHVTDPGGAYPHWARIDFDGGACLVQYQLPAGLVSGGQGYIVIP